MYPEIDHWLSAYRYEPTVLPLMTGWLMVDHRNVVGWNIFTHVDFLDCVAPCFGNLTQALKWHF